MMFRLWTHNFFQVLRHTALLHTQKVGSNVSRAAVIGFSRLEFLSNMCLSSWSGAGKEIAMGTTPTGSLS
jgi:hypothetical protein